MLLKKITAVFLSTIMAVSSFGAVGVMAKDKTKIYIVGDSTACKYERDDNYAVAREGWGMAFHYMVQDDKAEVVDLALSGRSSKSFIIEDNYKTLIDNMKSGDYLLIQFGHNDEKEDNPEEAAKDITRVRHTTVDGDKETEGSFKYYLYNYYIKPAEEKGVTPILLTPIARHEFDENGKVSDSHLGYDNTMKELAKECDVDCVDMTSLTTDLYNSLGEEQSMAYHAIFKSPEKGVYGHDNTHLNRYGALEVAELARTGLLNIDGIKDIIRPSRTYTSDYIQYYTVKRSDFASTMARTLGAVVVKDEAALNELENIDNKPVVVESNVNSVFSDVDKNTNPENIPESASYIQAAKDLGIIQGDDNGKFNPSSQLKFQDMAVMAARTIRKAGLEPVNMDNFTIKNQKDYASDGINVINYYFSNEIAKDVDANADIDLVSAYSMYVNVYDLLVSESDNNEIQVQSSADIEKVE